MHQSSPRASVDGFVPLLRPPADTTVLVGYCRSDEHRRWIEENGLYNMRFDGRAGSVELSSAEAAAEVLVLRDANYQVISVWWLATELDLLTEEEMRSRGYRNPRGSYLCRVLDDRWDHVPRLAEGALARILRGRRFGAPVATTWADLTEIATA